MGRYAPAILLVAAIVVAFITSLATYNWLRDRRVKTVVESVETIPVAVAAVDLYGGMVLTRPMVKMKSFMKESLNEGTFFSDPSQLEGRVVISPIRANEPVLLSRLAPESLSEGGIPAVIKNKKRAMSVKVDQIIGVSGFIKPGDLVDVLVTLGDPGSGAPITKIVLENMLVLAAGTQVQQGKPDTAPSSVNVITLEVTPEEAEKIALATSQGRIQLALRGYMDKEVVYTRGATLQSLLESYRIGAPVKTAQVFKSQKAKAVPARSSYTVWTVNGSAVQGAKVK